MKFWILTALGIVAVTAATTVAVLWTDSASAPPPLILQEPTANPTEGKFPKIVMETREKFIDGVGQFQHGQTAFALRNAGELPLELSRGETSCTCAGATLQRKPAESPSDKGLSTLTLLPNEEAEFVIDWDSKDRKGHFAVTAALHTNDPNEGRIVVKVELDVQTTVRAEPSIVSFGRVKEGDQATRTVYIVSEVLEDLKLLNASSTSDAVVAEILDATPEELKKFNARSGAKVQVTLRDTSSVGNFLQKLNIETNSETSKYVNVDLTGSVFGRFEVIPSKVDFAVLTAKKSHKKVVKIFAHGLDKERSLKVGKLLPAFLQAEIVQDKEFPTLWKMSIQVPDNAPTGAFNGAIEILDDQGKPKLSVDVQGIVGDSL